MDKEAFLDTFRDSIKAINNTRFFKTERGYQGELNSELRCRLRAKGIIPDEAIIEEEHQKTPDKQGINFRPDLIIHIPCEAGLTEDRRKGNFVVIQLKIRASLTEAQDDFGKIDEIIQNLDYVIGIFLTIDSDKTYRAHYIGV